VRIIVFGGVEMEGDETLYDAGKPGEPGVWVRRRVRWARGARPRGSVCLWIGVMVW
jgi:hypothetical protein